MEHEIIWGGDPEDALVIASGVATVEVLDDCREALVSNPRFRSGMRVLIDHRRVDWSQMTPADVSGVVDLLARATARFGTSYCAMVMSRPVDFGVGRMQQHYAEAHPELKVEFRIFMDIEDARRWLASLPEPTLDNEAS